MTVEKPIVLVVDDTIANIQILDQLLRNDYIVRVATNGEAAIKTAHSSPTPDIILLDIMMPGIDGYEVCKRLKDSELTHHIPIIFVTAMTDEDDEAKGLDLGAVDFITKPYSPRLVQARVFNHLAIKKRNDHLDQLVKERTLELFQSRAVTIEALAALAETRDKETGGHIKRTKFYMKHLTELLRKSSPSKWDFSDDTVQLYFDCAPMHDVGKVGIPDCILLKPGKLTHEEFEVMKGHTVLGYETLMQAEKNMGTDSFLGVGAEIAYTHHEKWDGSGYPKGLKGEEIPLPGRLMAIVDVYDAITSWRSYKPAMPHSEALAIIRENSGTHFDPLLVCTFEKIADLVEKFSASYEEKGR